MEIILYVFIRLSHSIMNTTRNMEIILHVVTRLSQSLSLTHSLARARARARALSLGGLASEGAGERDRVRGRVQFVPGRSAQQPCKRVYVGFRVQGVGFMY
jgi:hypothetical protein